MAIDEREKKHWYFQFLISNISAWRHAQYAYRLIPSCLVFLDDQPEQLHIWIKESLIAYGSQQAFVDHAQLDLSGRIPLTEQIERMHALFTHRSDELMQAALDSISSLASGFHLELPVQEMKTDVSEKFAMYSTAVSGYISIRDSDQLVRMQRPFQAVLSYGDTVATELEPYVETHTRLLKFMERGAQAEGKSTSTGLRSTRQEEGTPRTLMTIPLFLEWHEYGVRFWRLLKTYVRNASSAGDLPALANSLQGPQELVDAAKQVLDDITAIAVPFVGLPESDLSLLNPFDEDDEDDEF